MVCKEAPMHRCVKKIRFFLILLLFKVLALSALLMKVERSEKKIPHHQAIKTFNAYLAAKVKQKNIPLSQQEFEKIATAGHVIITAYGNHLTKDQFSKIKRNLRDYLKIRFPDQEKKSLKNLITHIPFRLAKQAIKARLYDHIQSRMGVMNVQYQKLLWYTIRSYVMHQLYEKSYFDDASGSLVVDQTDIASIVGSAQSLLSGYRTLPASSYQSASSTMVSKKKKLHLKKKSRSNRQTKHRKHLITRKQAARFVTEIIQRSGISKNEYQQVFKAIMSQIERRLVQGKIDHYLMKKLAYDEIKRHESSLEKRVCQICHKLTKAPNRKLFACNHFFHKTCLYKKFGTIEFLKSWKDAKKCPICAIK